MTTANTSMAKSFTGHTISAHRFVPYADVIDVEISEEKIKAKQEVPANAAKQMLTGNVVIVYNPFNHESLLAAAILTKNYPQYKAISFQDVIPTAPDHIIWLGVRKIMPTENIPFPKYVVHHEFTSSQPVYHTATHKGILSKIIGKPSLTEKQAQDNALVEYVNGAPVCDTDYQCFAKVTLIDKIMFHFDIENNGSYGYRYYSMLSKGWEKHDLTEKEEAAFYLTLKSAYASLQEKADFITAVPFEPAVDAYRAEFSKTFKTLANKATFHMAPTDNGSVKVAVVSLDAMANYIAQKYFHRANAAVLNIAHGINGGFFTGNVRMKKGVHFGDAKEYIEA